MAGIKDTVFVLQAMRDEREKKSLKIAFSPFLPLTHNKVVRLYDLM